MTVSPNEANIYTALRSFLTAVLPAGIEIVKGQVNRVAEPKGSDFVVMTSIRHDRIETNIDSYSDAKFTGTIAGNLLTVGSVAIGAVQVGATVFGAGVAANTTITGQGTGTGGIGTYNVNIQQAVPSTVLSAGLKSVMQPNKVTVQLDVHGPNSADNAVTIATLFRDEYAVNFFKSTGFDVAPLYADDPKQLPFSNAEQQIETRWVIEALLQANQVVAVPQQFADSVTIGIVSVDATYPP